MKPNIEFVEGVPADIQEHIIKACGWITREEQYTVDLIAARMQNIFMAGVLDGLRSGQDSAIRAIKNFGKAVQS